MKKRILVVTQYFYPEPFRINNICEELVDRGYDVTVITGIPNYPKGKFYKGYGIFKKRKEIYNNIKIKRIPLISRGNSKIRLFINYFSFVFFGFFFSKFTRIKADIVFAFEVSPIFQVKVANWFSKRRKIPSILYVQDLWPDNLEAIAGVKNKTVLKKVERITKKIYRESTKILTTSKSFVGAIHKMDVPYEKLEFWPQFAEEFYQEKPIKKEYTNIIPQDGNINICFAGNIGFAQGLDILPKVAEVLKRENIIVRFNMIGDGRAKEILVKDIDSRNVNEYFNFIGRVDGKEVPYYLACCDFALLTLKSNPIFDKTIPGKFQSYLACGIPIIASVSGDVNEIIKTNNLGLACEAGNTKELLDLIKISTSIDKSEILTFKNNAIKYNLDNFNKQKLFDRFEAIIEEEVSKYV